jgi:tripartite-type tricarboxylate transporter receptor subunit TctC
VSIDQRFSTEKRSPTGSFTSQPDLQTTHARARPFKWATQALFAVAMVTGPVQSFAQDVFPSRPVTMVVPYAGGGSSDTLGRILALKMSETLGQQVIVDLRPGAGGNIGANYVARQVKADGYTFLFAASSLASNVSLMKQSIDPRKELAPMAGVAAIPNLMVTAADGPYKSMNDVLTQARNNSNQIVFGSSGYGTGSHLSGELVKIAAGVNMTHVPYRGSGAVYQDLISGRVSVLFDVMGSALGMVNGGKVIPLGITSLKRAPSLPNVPTLAEQGLANFEMVTWFGMFVPLATPPEVVQKLNLAMRKTLEAPDIRKRLSELGAEPIPIGAAEFGQYVVNDIDRWEGLVKTGKIAPHNP